MNTKMRQLIIARKDLQMSPGKLAAQCCHASLAFVSSQLRSVNAELIDELEEFQCGDKYYQIPVAIEKDVWHNWICGVFTKTICEAKNKNQLMKAVTFANELGLVEGDDYFLIKDACLTELAPEEVDENGVGRVLTCIGFKPLPDEIIQQISRKFQLYK